MIMLPISYTGPVLGGLLLGLAFPPPFSPSLFHPFLPPSLLPSSPHPFRKGLLKPGVNISGDRAGLESSIPQWVSGRLLTLQALGILIYGVRKGGWCL